MALDLTHVGVFAVCIWVTFDPAKSLQHRECIECSNHFTSKWLSANNIFVVFNCHGNQRDSLVAIAIIKAVY